MKLYTAPIIVPMDKPLIENGAILSDDSNRIIAVDTAERIHEKAVEIFHRDKNEPDPFDYGSQDEMYEFQDAVLIPRVYNAHIHAEFGGLLNPLGNEGMPFDQWIKMVNSYRRSQWYKPEKNIINVLRRLETETNSFFNVLSLRQFNSDITSKFMFQFLELIGWTDELAEKACLSCPTHYLFLGRPGGFAPHAPYTVCKKLWENTVELSRKFNAPVTTHLAETQEELDFMRTGAGPLADMMRQADPAYNPAEVLLGNCPMAYLEFMTQFPQCIIAHGGYLSDEEIRFLGKHNDKFSVVYCPGTHRYFHRKPYPLEAMRKADVNLCIGTDSRASNKNESLFREIEEPLKSLSGQEKLEILCLNPVKAMGRFQQAGTLSRGKDLAFTMVPLQYFKDHFMADGSIK